MINARQWHVLKEVAPGPARKPIPALCPSFCQAQALAILSDFAYRLRHLVLAAQENPPCKSRSPWRGYPWLALCSCHPEDNQFTLALSNMNNLVFLPPLWLKLLAKRLCDFTGLSPNPSGSPTISKVGAQRRGGKRLLLLLFSKTAGRFLHQQIPSQTMKPPETKISFHQKDKFGQKFQTQLSKKSVPSPQMPPLYETYRTTYASSSSEKY